MRDCPNFFLVLIFLVFLIIFFLFILFFIKFFLLFFFNLNKINYLVLGEGVLKPKQYARMSKELIDIFYCTLLFSLTFFFYFISYSFFSNVFFFFFFFYL